MVRAIVSGNIVGIMVQRLCNMYTIADINVTYLYYICLSKQTNKICLMNKLPISTGASQNEANNLLQKELSNIRDEIWDNPYIAEAMRVLKVEGYRSAIGLYWDAVVDDLRKKIVCRSLDLFNKETGKNVKEYEDFQNNVTDCELIEGAYKIGVLGWEARKMMQQAREVRNIFSGHPASSDPSILKVLNMIADCNRYVLSQDNPVAIIDINKYITTMDSPDFAKNEMAIEQAFSDLPKEYRSKLANMFYSAYIEDNCSSILKANIQLCYPFLWEKMDKDERSKIGKRVDKEIVSGNKEKANRAIDFALCAPNGLRYVSSNTRLMLFEPAIKQLEDSRDQWTEEGKAVKRLERLGSIVPDELKERYVHNLAIAYVGYNGNSYYFSRTNFYSDVAAPVIIRIFGGFDDELTGIFIESAQKNSVLKKRISSSRKLARFRELATVLINRPNLRFDLQEELSLIIDESRTDEFMKSIGL